MEFPEELKQYVDGEVTFKQVGTAICDRFTYYVRNIDTNEEILALAGKRFVCQEIKKFDLYQILSNDGMYIGSCFIRQDVTDVSNFDYEDILHYPIPYMDDNSQRYHIGVVVCTQRDLHRLPDKCYENFNKRVMETVDYCDDCLLDDSFYIIPMNFEFLLRKSTPAAFIAQYTDKKDKTIGMVYCFLSYSKKIPITEKENN